MSVIIGVAALLRHDDRLVFEIQKPEKWHQRPAGLVEIGIGCIGGRLEPQETPRQALDREAREEIGCAIAIEPPPRVFLFDQHGSVRRLEAREAPEDAFFLWEQVRGGPDFIPGARVAVYLGRTLADPIPTGLPAVLEMPLGLLRDTLDGALTVQGVLDRGATLREREPVPRRARLRPVDTARIVAELAVRAPAHVQGV